MSNTSSSDLRLLLADKLTEAILFFNEYGGAEARRAVEDIVDDLLETMDIQIDEKASTNDRIVASIVLYDPTEYFTGVTIDVEE